MALSTDKLGRFNPQKPMENRITDLGPRHFWQYFPPIIQKNYGKWKYHEILEPGVLVHVAESGDKYCNGYFRFTTRNNIEFMTDSLDKVQALKKDLAGRKHVSGSFKFPI